MTRPYYAHSDEEKFRRRKGARREPRAATLFRPSPGAAISRSMKIATPTRQLKRRWRSIAAASCVALVGVGCGGEDPNVFDQDGGDGGAGASSSSAPTASGFPSTTSTMSTSATTTSAATASTATSSSGGEVGGGGQGGDGGGAPCGSAPTADGDGDGFTGDEGDCDDCAFDVNPGATEVAGNGVDDDCNGVIDEQTACDDGLALDDGDPVSAARAMGICTTVAADGSGLVGARWVRAAGGPAAPSTQAGIFPQFGPAVPPLQGSRLLAISTGAARLPGQAGACNSETCSYGAGAAPNGFPQAVPNCGVQSNINDDIGLEVDLVAPPGATGYRYRFRFYSFEYPEYVCTEYNDQYVAIASPSPPGAPNGNISTQGGYPIGVNVPIPACSSCQPWADACVNAALFNPDIVCPPVPSQCCADGPSALNGTGFDVWATAGAGATRWLETQAPISGGDEVTIRFAIWDAGDSALDSTTLLDDFAWLSTPDVQLGTAEVGD